MIGYIQSADDSGDYKKLKITLIHCEDFALADYGFEKEVYIVERFSGKTVRIDAPNTTERADSQLLQKIVALLRTCELEQKYALCLAWRSVGETGAETVGYDAMEGVWLPLPVLNTEDEGLYINITPLLFKQTPKPLENSFVCDMMSLLATICQIDVSNPFVNVGNGIFCSGKLLGVLDKIFDEDFLSFKNMQHTKAELNTEGKLKKFKTKLSRSMLQKLLSQAALPPTTRYDGTEQYFLVGAKRDCLSSLIQSLLLCLERGYGLKRFLVYARRHITTALKRIKAFGEILVIKGHISRLSDINYIEFYRLLEAFSFQEKSLMLKTTVRLAADRHRILGKCNVPDYVARHSSAKDV